MKIYLFSDSLGENIGGMEVHQQAFLKYYYDTILVVRGECISTYKYGKLCRRFDGLEALAEYLRDDRESKNIFFFNNLSWLRDIGSLRREFSDDVFIMRSGGNDIYKALDRMTMLTLDEKLQITAETINRYIDKLIINSDYSYFRNIDAGIFPERMMKIRGGVDCSSAECNIGNKAEIRRQIDEKYGTRGKMLLVIAARFVPFKGIVEFILNLAADPIRYSVHLLLIGDGKQKKTILELLENSDISYTYLGMRCNEETMRYIAGADLFVNPSLEFTEECSGGSFIHTETMGRGMMEAIMQGTPVIALDSGGTAELFYENSSRGYLAGNHSEMLFWLNKAFESLCHFKKDVDYSWNEVFRKYDLLFAFLTGEQHAPVLLAFDFDGTVKTDSCTEDELSNLMRSDENITYVCLTARSAEESLPLMNLLPLRCIVYENGAGIASRDGCHVFWNKLADDEKQKGEIERIISELKGTVQFRQTHPFTVHIRKEDISGDITEKLRRIICGTSFQIVGSEKFIKIQHIVFNKKGALDYIRKDLCCSYTVGAGDGLNDAAFILGCDRKYMHEDLVKSIECHDKEVIPFNEDEAGDLLLKRIMNDCNRKG